MFFAITLTVIFVAISAIFGMAVGREGASLHNMSRRDIRLCGRTGACIMGSLTYAFMQYQLSNGNCDTLSMIKAGLTPQPLVLFWPILMIIIFAFQHPVKVAIHYLARAFRR